MGDRGYLRPWCWQRRRRRGVPAPLRSLPSPAGCRSCSATGWAPRMSSAEKGCGQRQVSREAAPICLKRARIIFFSFRPHTAATPPLLAQERETSHSHLPSSSSARCRPGWVCFRGRGRSRRAGYCGSTTGSQSGLWAGRESLRKTINSLTENLSYIV